MPTKDEQKLAERPVEDYGREELRAMAQDLKSEYHDLGPRGVAMRERLRQMLDAQRRDEQRELRPIPPSAVSALGYARNAITVDVPAGTPTSRLADPVLWSLIPPIHLKPNTLVWAFEENDEYVANVLLRCNKDGSGLAVKVLKVDPLEPRMQASPTLLPSDRYRIEALPAHGTFQAWFTHPSSGANVRLGEPCTTWEQARQVCYQHAQSTAPGGRPTIYA
jgi:hypothetical protein